MRADEFLEVLAPDDILVRGTRIPLECVIYAHQDGLSPEEIVAEYPSVSLAHAHAVIAYYHSNRQDVEQYLARAEEAERHRSEERSKRRPPVGDRLRSLKAQGTARPAARP